jgi:TP901 family phage tail tape measure protein
VPNRTVAVELKARVASYVAGMKQAAQATHNFVDKASRQIEDHSAELSRLGTGLAVTGAGMLLVAGKAVKTFADFDRQMSAVAATGDDARASLDGLRKTAIKAGADTQYSAQEAAQGITNLLKAGRSASAVIGGDLTGVLNLAAAGQLEVADAAEIAANTMNQFGDSAVSVTHVADLLVSGANAASGEVSDMAAALNNVGGIAHQMGYSLEETIGFLTEMAFAGRTGAEAGTQFKSMLLQLQAPSEKQKDALADLNLSLYDSAGNTKRLTRFIDEYRASLEGKTQAEKDSYNAIIFGSYGIQAANVAYTEAGGSLQQWIDLINQQGAAQRQAATLTDNLAGDIERLGGSLDTAFIQSGSGANSVLRQMAQGANVLVDAIGGLPEPLLSTITMLTGVGGLTTLGVAGLLKLASAASDARANFKALGISAKTAKLAVGGIGAAIAVGTIALSAWADAQAQAKANTDDFASTLIVVDGQVLTTSATLQEINDKLAETQTLLGWGPTLMDLMSTVGVSAMDAQGYLAGEADAIDRVNAAMDAYVRANPLFGSSPTTMLRQGLDQLRGSMTEAERVTLQKAQADEEAGVSSENLSTALRKQGTDAEGAAEDLKTLTAALYDNQDAAIAVTNSEVGFEQAIDDSRTAVNKLIKATKDHRDLQDLNTQAGRDAMTVLTGLASKTNDHVKDLIKQGKTEDEITGAMERGRQAFANRARDLGYNEHQIADLIATYLQVPENVTTDVNAEGADGAKTRVNALFDAIKDLPKSTQADILSEFNNKGIQAAEAALNKIGKKVVHPKVDPQLTKSTLYVKVVRGKSGSGGGGRSDLDRDNARGNLYVDHLAGLVTSFASGGFGIPQVRPFQGDAGVRWGERGSGPWEAFISGAPQNRDRSIAIWRETGDRLGASREAADVRFADGAVLPYQRGTDVSGYMASGAVITNHIHNESGAPHVRPTRDVRITNIGPDAREVTALTMAQLRHEQAAEAVQWG